MVNRILSLVILTISISSSAFAQQNSGEVSILFYNVENLFDTVNNPETNDDNFTPDGELHWTNKRLNLKLLNISKVILSAGGWNVPDIVAISEVENRLVLEKLIYETPLKSVPYKIIHKESPDHRGIDVAFLYNSDHFYPLQYQNYPLQTDDKSEIKTREILYVAGILNKKDTLHFFINHWPSRYSGVLETKLLRNAAAKVLRQKVEDLNKKYQFPKIIILGDFNDNPTDKSISEVLKANSISENILSDELYNMSAAWLKNDLGTLKFQSQWFFFDQLIISGSLLNSKSGFFVAPENAEIVDFPFLLQKDEKYTGLKPWRTYFGFTYEGGFSDHLPVLLKLNSSN